jgi:ParB family transcriptional regulator, chromosome partitioning protein
MPAQIKIAAPLLRKPALGRGLSALIPEARSPLSQPGIVRLPIGDVHADRANPRRDFDEAALEELAASLKAQGMLQPVLVRKDGKQYRLIAGERRWRAAQRAGFDEIPVIVKEATDAQAFEFALVENIQRADLNPLEEAEAYRRLMDERKMTQEAVAERVGKERSTVANALRLLSLPNEVKQLLVEGDLEMGHARALLGLSKASDMTQLARAVVGDKLSVRDTEARVRALKGAPALAKKKVNGQSADAKKLIEDLQRALGTKVSLVESGAGRGSLRIEFFSYEDLDRIVRRIRK